MQFKSIIAVLALALAATATPIEPVAVNLVARTDPPPATTTTVQSCKNGQVFLSKCTALGKTLNPATNNGGLLALIDIALSLGLVVQCVVNGVNVVSVGGACCNFKDNSPTTTQNGLVNVNNINLGSCSAT